ncbi:MAG: DotU family type IV/VI secretion system protein [Planctomycetales bacterium]
MTPQFSRACDPVFLSVLGLEDRINRGAEPDPETERLRVVAALDQAEAIIGFSEEWMLAKYALVSWIDEVLLEAPWQGRDWWSNNVLEIELFNSRLCNELFYVKAQEAGTLSSRDALEVFYVCVVLGFRGLYRDPSSAEITATQHGLPGNLDSWARQTATAIRLGQGLPSLKTGGEEGAGAPPLEGQGSMVWSVIMCAILGTVAVMYCFHTFVNL